MIVTRPSDQVTVTSGTVIVFETMEGFKWPCSHVWHLHNVFNLVLFGFWVTNAFDTLFYFLCFCHYSLYKCCIKRNDKIWKAWKFSFISDMENIPL